MNKNNKILISLLILVSTLCLIGAGTGSVARLTLTDQAGVCPINDVYVINIANGNGFRCNSGTWANVTPSGTSFDPLSTTSAYINEDFVSLIYGGTGLYEWTRIGTGDIAGVVGNIPYHPYIFVLTSGGASGNKITSYLQGYNVLNNFFYWRESTVATNRFRCIFRSNTTSLSGGWCGMRDLADQGIPIDTALNNGHYIGAGWSTTSQTGCTVGSWSTTNLMVVTAAGTGAIQCVDTGLAMVDNAWWDVTITGTNSTATWTVKKAGGGQATNTLTVTYLPNNNGAAPQFGVVTNTNAAKTITADFIAFQQTYNAERVVP